MPNDDPNTPPEQSPEEKINALVNSVVSSHLKRSQAKQLEDFKALIADQLKSFAPPPPPPPPEAEPKKSTVQDPAFVAMQSKFEAMTKALEAETAKRTAAENKQREDRAYNDMKEGLKSKVRPDMVDFVADHLFHAKKRVEFDAEGNPLFKSRRSPSPGMAEEDILMPLADGVASWLSSKDAAVFLPAPAPSQQVNRGPKMPTQQNVPGVLPKYDAPASTDAEKVRRAFESEQAILRNQK